MKATTPLVLALAALLGAAAIVAAEFVPDATLAQILVLSLLTLILMSVAIALRPEQQMPILCDPLVLACAFLAQFFVLAPVLAHLTGFQTLVFFIPPKPSTIVTTMAAFVLMLAFCILGNRVRLGVMVADLLPSFGPRPRKLPRRWIEMFILLASGAGCMAWIQYNGGILGALNVGYGARNSPPAFGIAFKSLLVVTFLLAWRVIGASRRRRSDWILLGAVLLFDAVFFGIYFGARKYLLFLFFGILTIWLLRRGLGQLPKARASAVLLLLIVYFSVWGSIRSKPVSVMMGMSSDYRPAADLGMHFGMVTGLVAPFGGACKVMEIFPETEPFKHGSTLLVVLFMPIPRAIWPGKPIGIGREITYYYSGPFYEYSGGWSVAPTILGEYWINFGWIGVMVGGFLLGLLFRVMTRYAVTGMKDGLQLRAARVLIPATFVASLGEVRADLGALLVTWGLQLGPLLFALMFFDLDEQGAVKAIDVGNGRRAIHGSRVPV
jgi:hypothetical protein